MYLIAILMTALLMGRGGLSQRVDYSQAPSHDRLSDYPELQGIVHSLLNEDSEKCADVSVDCSDFPATVCEGDVKEVDFHLPDSYCQKVICCTKEIAREKIVFTGSQSMENKLRKSELMKWANAEKQRMEAKGVWHGEPARKLPQPTRKSSRGRPHSKKTTASGTKNGGARRVLDEKAARDFLIKARQRMQLMKADMDNRYLRRQREPQDLQLRPSDRIVKATTVQPLTEVKVTPKYMVFRKSKPNNSQSRRLEVTTETPVTQTMSTTFFPGDTSLERVIEFSTKQPKTKKKQAKKPLRAENHPFNIEDIAFRDMKPLPTEASQDNQSKSTTVIRDFTTPRSFPEMWHERGLAATTKGPAPEESKQRYDVQQNFLELCGSIAAHADNNMNASSQGIVQGSDEQDLKANGAGCYEDFVKPAHRGNTRSKTPTRKLVKSSARGRGGPNEENLYKPQKWQRPNPLLGAAGPQTPLPPKQRQRLPVSPYLGTPRHTGGSSYPGSSFPGGSSYPGSSFPGGSSYPGSSYPGGASYPGSSYPGGATYPGSSYPGGASYPGSSHPGGASYPRSPYQPGPITQSGAHYPGSYPFSGSPLPVSPYLPNPSAKRPAKHRQQPIYPVEDDSDSEEDSTDEDDCDDRAGSSGGQPDFESQLNTYFDPPNSDEIVGAVRSFGVGNPSGNSWNNAPHDDEDYDGQHYGPKGAYGFGKYPGGMGAGRYPGGANKNRGKPPSVYVNKVVKPSRGREVSVPGHTLRELKIFGQFKNGLGELCDEASENEEVQNTPTARPAIEDKKNTENLLGDSEETSSSKKFKGRERRRLDQDEKDSKETEFST